MAKLKCDKHKLRVFVIKGQFLHRGGWTTLCDSPTATIGTNTYTAKAIEENGASDVPRKLKKFVTHD